MGACNSAPSVASDNDETLGLGIGPSAQMTGPLRAAAKKRGQQLATIDIPSSRKWTWSELAGRVAKVAGALQGLGVSRETKVAVLSLNSDRYYEAYFAIPWVGGVIVPLNVRLALPEVQDICNNAGVEILLVDEAFKGMISGIKQEVKSVKTVIFLGDDGTPDGCESYEILLGKASPAIDLCRGGDDLFGLFYTGGTTGKSKGVMLTHANCYVNGLGSTRLYDDESRYMHSGPMFHLANGIGMFAITFAAGSHVFIPRFAPDAFIAGIDQHSATSAMGVPAMVQMLLSFPGMEGKSMSSLSLFVYGGSPMSEALISEAMKTFTNAKFMQGYGMTECGPGITNLDPKYHIGPGAKLKSVGKPVAWTEVRIVGENDQDLPPGETGEILVRGPGVMKGYYKMPEQTASAIRGGWMHTGDGGYMDAEGFVFLKDRLKDMIISGGENVYSAEVENVVMGYAPVAMCAVIGTPDEKLGELVTVIVQLKESPPFVEEDLLKHCRASLAGFKLPRKVVVSKEPLPLSGAGKILKHELRKPYWENGGKGNAIYAADGKQATAYK